MGFLSPAFLAAGAAVAVPLILHLFHRQDARRMPFPALRYLLRTEKEHARTIRLRQLLLLLLRMAIIVLLVGAGARPFLRGGGGTHEPTAVVIVLDNSMSSGLIRGGDRVLDLLKGVAARSVEQASDEDRLWLIRAGEPWHLAITGSRTELREAVLTTDVTEAAGALRPALARAVALVSGAEFPASEIHLISDLQHSAFDAAAQSDPPHSVPVVVFDGSSPAPENAYLDSLLIGGGLPPLANQRTRLSILVAGDSGDDSLPLRLVIGGRIRGAASARPGVSAIFPLGPFGIGRVSGYVESDPDDLRSDDRRYFIFQVRPPPEVATAGVPPFFLAEALTVLTDAGRIRLTPAQDAEVLVSVAGAGVTQSTGSTRATIIVPPGDVALVPGLNRALAAVGIPWSYALIDGRGEAAIAEWAGSVDLSEVRVRSHYLLMPSVAAPEAEVVARLSSGEPWIVEGATPRGRYLMLASDLEEASTNLGVTTAMVPLLEWMVARWGGPAAVSEGPVAGEAMPTPPEATGVRDPRGGLHPVDGARPFHATRWTGGYEILQGDSILQILAVNTSSSESVLTPIEPEDLESLLPGPMTLVADSTRWARALFSTGQGPEIWRWLLAAAVFVLVAESLVAASGPAATSGASEALPRARGPALT